MVVIRLWRGNSRLDGEYSRVIEDVNRGRFYVGYGPFGNLGMNTIDDDCDKRTLDLDSDDFEYIPPVTYSAVDDFLAEQDDDEDD